MRLLLLSLGWLSLLCGLAGVFLPLVPTTPFVLLSAGLFARSSPATRQWLLSRPHLGAMVEDWEKRGAIAAATKRRATWVLIPVFLFSIFWIGLRGTPLAPWLTLFLLCLLAGLLSFIWSRPS